jgi:hypothetical protein
MALLEVLCGQLPYGQWVATPLPALGTLYLFNRLIPPGFSGLFILAAFTLFSRLIFY